MGDLSSTMPASVDDVVILQNALRGRIEMMKKMEVRIQLDQIERDKDQDRIRVLEAKLRRQEEEILTANRRASNLSQELATMRPELHQSRHRETTLRSELEQSQTVIKRLEQRNKFGQSNDLLRLTTSLDQHKQELNTLRPALHNAMGRIGYLEAQLNQSQQEVIQLKGKLQRNENILHQAEAELYKRNIQAVPPRMMLANIHNTGVPLPQVPRRDVASQTNPIRRRDTASQTTPVKFKGKAIQTYRSSTDRPLQEPVSGGNYSEDSEEDHPANVTPLTEVSSPTSSQDSGESGSGEQKKKKRLSGAARRKLRKMWQQEAELSASREREQSPLMGRLMSAEAPLAAIMEEDEPRPTTRMREVEGPSSMPAITRFVGQSRPYFGTGFEGYTTSFTKP